MTGSYPLSFSVKQQYTLTFSPEWIKSVLFPCLFVHISVVILKQLDQHIQQIGSIAWNTSTVFKCVSSVVCFWNPEYRCIYYGTVQAMFVLLISQAARIFWKLAHTAAVNTDALFSLLLLLFDWVTHVFFKQASTLLSFFSVKSSGNKNSSCTEDDANTLMIKGTERVKEFCMWEDAMCPCTLRSYTYMHKHGQGFKTQQACLCWETTLGNIYWSGCGVAGE